MPRRRIIAFLLLWATIVCASCNSCRNVPTFQQGEDRIADASDMAASDVRPDLRTDAADSSDMPDLADVDAGPCPTVGEQCETRWQCPGLGDCECGTCAVGVEWYFLTLGVEGTAPDAVAMARRGVVRFSDPQDFGAFEVLWEESIGSPLQDAPGIAGRFGVDDDRRVDLDFEGSHHGWLDSKGAFMVVASESSPQHSYFVRLGNPTFVSSYLARGLVARADETRTSTQINIASNGTSIMEDSMDGEPIDTPAASDNGELVLQTPSYRAVGYLSATGDHIVFAREDSNGAIVGGAIGSRGRAGATTLDSLAGRYGVAVLVIPEAPEDAASSVTAMLEFDGAGGFVSGDLTSLPGGTQSTLQPESLYEGASVQRALQAQLLDSAGTRACYLVFPDDSSIPTQSFNGVTRNPTTCAPDTDIASVLLGLRLP